MDSGLAIVYVDGRDTAMRHLAWDLLRQGLVQKANYLSSNELFLKDGRKEKMSSSGYTLQLLCKSAEVDKVFTKLASGMTAFAVPVLKTRL